MRRKGPKPRVLDETDKRLSGIFTPPELADRMAAKFPEADLGPTKTALDPCCGDGALLLALARRRLALGVTKADIAATQWGIEIQPRHHAACIENLVAFLGEENREVIESRIILGDFLEMSKARANSDGNKP